MGGHILQVFGTDGRWLVAVDGVLVDGWHACNADAWAVGVAHAGRIDGVSRPSRGSFAVAPSEARTP